ncbi:MAG: SMC-Scp complex subunit ScpB [Oscillospiraceae bacterium]|jgi:segregation and condensation protein B|nr:SMC-Scp complex subunit ScpB [Oscillospiraceae bacterium]
MNEKQMLTELESAIEGILFSSGEPVLPEKLAEAAMAEVSDVLAAAESLRTRYETFGHGIRLISIESGLQLVSAPPHADLIRRALDFRKAARLSAAQLETLSCVAYFQPITRGYVDRIRGADSQYCLGILLSRGLIERTGHLDVPGRPTLYGTTDEFLRVFGIEALSQLPALPKEEEDEAAIASLVE